MSPCHPISYCHVTLVLLYLKYLLKLPAHHYACAAFDNAWLLHTKKPSCWGKLLSCAAVVLLRVLCLKCATSVADETVEVSQARPGSR